MKLNVAGLCVNAQTINARFAGLANRIVFGIRFITAVNVPLAGRGHHRIAFLFAVTALSGAMAVLRLILNGVCVGGCGCPGMGMRLLSRCGCGMGVCFCLMMVVGRL